MVRCLFLLRDIIWFVLFCYFCIFFFKQKTAYEIGVTSGSRLTQEFDVTEALASPGQHQLDVRVVQWSVNTYVEDQDMWWMSGIFRSVDLLLRPAGGIHDLATVTDFDPATGKGTVQVTVHGADGAPIGATVEVPALGIREDVGPGTDRKSTRL